MLSQLLNIYSKIKVHYKVYTKIQSHIFNKFYIFKL